MPPNPMEPVFWEDAKKTLYLLLLPEIQKAIETGALNAYADLIATVDIGISLQLVNQSIPLWASKYTTELVGQITKTSMAAFIENFGPWLESGKPLKELISTLTPYYGPVRARMVAVTETTRAFAMGNVSVWKTTGVVDGYNVRTAEDDLVCPICQAARAGNPYRLDSPVPPFHVLCRCWISPIVELR